jgi:hypothetical protein
MTCEKSPDSEAADQPSERKIADEAVRRDLVKNISQRLAGQLLKRGGERLNGCARRSIRFAVA